MALSDFWNSIRAAASEIVPWRNISQPPIVVANPLEILLKTPEKWLKRNLAAGFAEADFNFLPEEECFHLAKLVNDLRPIASSLSLRRPASAQAVEQAAPLVLGIVELLRFDKYLDPDAYRLGKLFEKELRQEWPEELESLRFETGLAYGGDPGLWIMVILKDTSAESDEQFLANTRELRPFLDNVAREVSTERFPYIKFRSAAGERELLETT